MDKLLIYYPCHLRRSPSKNMNAVVEQFGGNTDKNGEVSYSWKVPGNTPIGTPYIIKVDALSGKYSVRSESNIFTAKPCLTTILLFHLRLVGTLLTV